MTNDEIKQKILAFLNSAIGDDVEIDFDSLNVTRVDDGAFKLTMLVNLDEDEDEEDDEDEDFNEEDVEAEESDFEDEEK